MLEWDVSEEVLRGVLKVVLGTLALTLIVLAVLILQTPIGTLLERLAGWLFALSSVQAMWYVTRAAGLAAYLLFWLSTVWGLAVTNKILDPALPRTFTFDAHEFLSLLAIGFTALHVAVLMADRYLPFSFAQIVVPFAAPYRPVWVGLGVIGLYLTLLVTVTFYARRWIGARAFRLIHYLSFVTYVAVTLHGWFAGTDTPLWTTQLMYAGSVLVVVFLTAYRAALALAAA